MALLKRRKNAKLIYREKERIWCSRCKKRSIISWDDVKEILCGDCFAREIFKSETQIQTTKLNFERGWNLKKKFKAPDGTIYSFGKKITGEKNVRNSK
jgi:hypothetical protein